MKTFFKKLLPKQKIIMKEIGVQTDIDLLACSCGNKNVIINCNKHCNECDIWFEDYTPRTSNWNYSNCQIKH